jgi:hypothetical protein
VYRLVDPVTGEVVRTGDLAARRGQHARATETANYRFEVIFRTDNYAEQRGLEQLAHEAHGRPRLNKISPIASRNPRRNHYLNAADDFLTMFGIG